MDSDNIGLGDGSRILTDDELHAVSGGMRNIDTPLAHAFVDGFYVGACVNGLGGGACYAAMALGDVQDNIINMTVIPGK